MANQVQSTGGNAAIAASVELEVKNDSGGALPVSISTPSASSDTWSRYDSVAYENSEVVKASAGIFRGVTGYNSGPAQWIQIHNTTTVVADTAVPAIIVPVAAQSSFIWSAGEKGTWFTTGIMVCNSTTGPTKTIGAADCFFNALYK